MCGSIVHCLDVHRWAYGASPPQIDQGLDMVHGNCRALGPWALYVLGTKREA
jgi:hypothetical protein